MNTNEAYAILETLMDGVNPVSGEILPEDHVCLEPLVLCALHKAMMGLKEDTWSHEPAGSHMVNRNGKLNAGRPWTESDIATLRALVEANTPMDDMCRLLQRRRRGIEHQLLSLGLSDGAEQRRSVQVGRERAGMPWSVEEDSQLWNMWKQGAKKNDIAKALHRSSYAVHCRMEQMGMQNQEEEEEQPLLPPMTLADVRRMKALHDAGCPADGIAEEFNMSVESIKARLFYMGLTKEAPILLKREAASKE